MPSPGLAIQDGRRGAGSTTTFSAFRCEGAAALAFHSLLYFRRRSASVIPHAVYHEPHAAISSRWFHGIGRLWPIEISLLHTPPSLRRLMGRFCRPLAMDFYFAHATMMISAEKMIDHATPRRTPPSATAFCCAKMPSALFAAALISFSMTIS